MEPPAIIRKKESPFVEKQVELVLVVFVVDSLAIVIVFFPVAYFQSIGVLSWKTLFAQKIRTSLVCEDLPILESEALSCASRWLACEHAFVFNIQ